MGTSHTSRTVQVLRQLHQQVLQQIGADLEETVSDTGVLTNPENYSSAQIVQMVYHDGLALIFYCLMQKEAGVDCTVEDLAKDSKTVAKVRKIPELKALSEEWLAFQRAVKAYELAPLPATLLRLAAKYKSKLATVGNSEALTVVRAVQAYKLYKKMHDSVQSVLVAPYASPSELRDREKQSATLLAHVKKVAQVLDPEELAARLEDARGLKHLQSLVGGPAGDQDAMLGLGDLPSWETLSVPQQAAVMLFLLQEDNFALFDVLAGRLFRAYKDSIDRSIASAAFRVPTPAVKAVLFKEFYGKDLRKLISSMLEDTIVEDVLLDDVEGVFDFTDAWFESAKASDRYAITQAAKQTLKPLDAWNDAYMRAVKGIGNSVGIWLGQEQLIPMVWVPFLIKEFDKSKNP